MHKGVECMGDEGGEPTCEHTEPWKRGCPACDPRCEHGVGAVRPKKP
jgi:hypothetical protein